MSDSDVSTVRGAYDAFGRGDVPAIIALLADSVEWHAPEVLPHGGSFRGRDGVGAFFQGIGAKWESLQVQTSEFLDAGGQVVVLGRASGTLRGVGAADYGFVHVFTLADGAVTRFREYVDPGDAIIATSRG
jgi:uncharacterized protein